MLKNIEAKVDENNILILKIDLNKDYGKSTSGKTTVIASAGRGASIPGQENIGFSLSVYKYPERD